ncbi:MAG: dTDP-glucose 4,6-dehydratase [Anaerolineales bacterium]
MKNILVTGGAGFIGSNFVRFLLYKEPHVRIINLDALTYAGRLENLTQLPDPDRYVFVHGNICDERLVQQLFTEYDIDTVVHFAAESHVDRSILNPKAFLDTNVYGTFTLLETARRVWLQNPDAPDKFRFHHISTDEVFGSLGSNDPPFSETTPYAPNSPYAASKAASDHLVRVYGHTYGLPYTITNCSNNYGPYQFPEKMIPLMILNAVEGKPLPVYGDGQQVRDWLYVEDHCEAIWLVLRKGLVGETFNIGGGNQPTNLSIVETICDIVDNLQPRSSFIPHRKLIQFVPDRPGHDRRYAMDITKIRNTLGWQPRHDLMDGLYLTVKWYLDHPKWVEAIRKTGDYQDWLRKNYQERGNMI